MTRRNFTNKCGEYKWCNDTPTKPKPQVPNTPNPTISHKYKLFFFAAIAATLCFFSCSLTPTICHTLMLLHLMDVKPKYAT